ncbi:MAG TPA: dihydroxyacetone kinase subunit DhaK [Methylococcaceae bacterium]|jgi:dihydroxyacetone kinase-like protein|nr:dihydroxyacetone kinase subunit DhaK [Methylococcaceae bacterium]HIN68721.1 dihydroxyacetone kinase subunit DhaK [Methylococcales bacterium]HIA45048.1 dihydroxyacetone kinase subunit DhaK [Methylococcaceae bacterium]HIB61593.1 dihydroxyacetone kinase subunit DhaK [Methylococcaceae bacterium]HIO13222.1 dihydroxyacetone kinase subunit DhaK [Methylococcales bacterium]
MKKLINNPDDLFPDSLAGFASAHANIVQLHSNPYFVYRKNKPTAPKVALISGGGSGHEPLHSGFVGTGMLDAACPGHIFTSPTPDQMAAAAATVENDAGILFIVKNYAGDIMNFEIASEIITAPIETIIVADDIALPKEHSMGRRGVAGTLMIEKMVGAAADCHHDLAYCKSLGDRISDNTASIGAALTSCTVPALGKPTFDISETEIEMGVGIHGERGHSTQKFTDATTLTHYLAEAIYDELKPKKGQEALLHINGLGATPLIEQYLIYEIAQKFWSKQGISITRSLVGNYTTSLDMAGCSMTLTLLDTELTTLWDHPVNTANLRWGC